MNFKEFADTIVNRIPEYLMQYDIEQVKLDTVLKNNGVSYTGLVICVKGEKIFPNIYLEYFYALYQGGHDLDEILGTIRDEYIEARERVIPEAYTEINEKNIKEYLFLKIINYEKNREMLSECPYIPFHDLAVTFRYLVSHNEQGIASAIVRNQDMDNWKMTTEELYALAKKNTAKLFPVMLKSLDEMLHENIPDWDAPGVGMYVLTNEQKVNGAAYMLYKDVLSAFAEKHQSGFYILPSSIHEVLLLPDNMNVDVGYLRETVQDVNSCAVSEMDFLSDNVYYYNREIGNILICEE